MHTHTHQHGHSDRRSLLIAIAVTGTIFIAEVVGGLLSRSLALLSDAGHMLTDLLSLLVALLGLSFAMRPRDQVPSRYTYGYRRLETITALFNAVTLLLMCVYIVYEAVERLLSDPVPIQLPLMMGVAAVGLVGNIISAQFLRHSHSLNVRSAYLHVLMDLLSSVAVLIGGGIIWLTRAYWIDPVLSVLIVIFIIRSALPILRRSMNILLDAAPPNLDVATVTRLMQTVEGVRNVHDVHIWQLSDRTCAMSAHVVVDNAVDRDTILRRLQQLVREQFQIQHATFQIESAAYAQQEACVECRLDQSPEPHEQKLAVSPVVAQRSSLPAEDEDSSP